MRSVLQVARISFFFLVGGELGLTRVMVSGVEMFPLLVPSQISNKTRLMKYTF